jgi:succinate dehydrogenase / fumarate reductase cytochrome b subunit
VTRAQGLFAIALAAVAVVITVVALKVPSRVRRDGTTYRGAPGQWAFYAHRITGFLVFAFLLLHVVDVSLVRWPSTYNEVHRIYGNVVMRLFEVGLLFSLLFHALNGLRIIAVDFFPGAVANEGRLLTAAVVLTVAAGVPAGIVILWPFLSGRF